MRRRLCWARGCVGPPSTLPTTAVSLSWCCHGDGQWVNWQPKCCSPHHPLHPLLPPGAGAAAVAAAGSGEREASESHRVPGGHPPTHHAAHLGIAHSLNPAAAQRLPTGLESVGGHSTAQLVQVDEEEGACGQRPSAVSRDPPLQPTSPPVLLTRVPQLPADHLVHQQGLPNHLGALSLLERLSDEEEVSEEEAVNIHLRAITGP